VLARTDTTLVIDMGTVASKNTEYHPRVLLACIDDIEPDPEAGR
jgi:hypothetical protein